MRKHFVGCVLPNGRGIAPQYCWTGSLAPRANVLLAPRANVLLAPRANALLALLSAGTEISETRHTRFIPMLEVESYSRLVIIIDF